MNQEQWDELKRLRDEYALTWQAYTADYERLPAYEDAKRAFAAQVSKHFPAILAEREAAQRLRDALVEISTFPRYKMPSDIAKDALATFDKETQNEG